MRILKICSHLLMGSSCLVGALSMSSVGVDSDEEEIFPEEFLRGYRLSSKEIESRFLQGGADLGGAPTVFHRDLVLQVAQALSHKANIDDEPVVLSLPLTRFIPILAGWDVSEQDSLLEFQVLECMTTKGGKDQQKAKTVPPGLVSQWPKFLDKYTMSCSGVALVDLSVYGMGVLSGSASFLCPQGNEECEVFFSSAATRKLTEEKAQQMQNEGTQMPHEAASDNRTLRGTLERSLATVCPRPPGWCSHSGGNYVEGPCTSPLLFVPFHVEHMCWDSQGYRWAVRYDCYQLGPLVDPMVCPKVFGCQRPSGWCTHPGAKYTIADCDGDGGLEHVCWDVDGYRGVLGHNLGTGSCQDSWWTAPATSCPSVFGICERPGGWCGHPDELYFYADCDGDGKPDHVCWNKINGNRGIISSSQNCADNWPNAAIDSCPSLFIPPKPLVSYIPAWGACPFDAQVAKHTHLIYAFAHSGNQWNDSKECMLVCQTTCSLTFDLPAWVLAGTTPCLCSDIQRWQEAGKKVLVSFGGDGQGRLYHKKNISCYQPLCCPSCWDNLMTCGVSKVADLLVALVNRHGFDGVDINYEYVVDEADVSNLHAEAGSNFVSPSATYIQFLGDLTRQLKGKLPAGRNIVTHAPMAVKLSSGSPYFNLLGQLKDENMIDFVFPQYYNTLSELSPKNNSGDGRTGGLVAHYEALAARLGREKVLIGLCPDVPVGKSAGYNFLGCTKMDDVTPDQAKALVSKVNPGGVMVWASQANVDVMASWSSAVYPDNFVIPTPRSAQSCEQTRQWSPPTTAAPTTAPAPAPAPAPTCFSGPSCVQMLDKGPLAMKELQVGDPILTSTTDQKGGQVYEPVYAFGHLNYHSSSIFLQITAMDSQFPGSLTTLEMTSDHMLFLFHQPNPVPARVIKAGDRLQGEGSSSELTVVRVKSVQRHDGVFAPFTPSGRLVVDGIQVSAYVSLRNKDNDTANSSILYNSAVLGIISEHNLSHLMTSPLRVWCMAKVPFLTAKWCRHPSYYDDDGILILAKTAKDLFEASAELHAVGQVVAFLVVALIYTFEVVFGAEYVLFAVSVMVVTVSFVRIMGLRFTVIGSRKKLKAV